jgi:ADP-ribose pyrophosphatase YjhB (NUDIX family)
VPPGDDRERFVCDACGTIHYQNPKIVTGCLPIYEGRVLLCKRAIRPRSGLWTLPAGFLENGETTVEGAIRETREEACAEVSVHGLYTVFNLPHISQIYMFFRADLTNLDFSAGPESADVRLFEESQIPWDELAFPVIRDTLRHYFNDRPAGDFPVRVGDIRYKER